MKRQVPEDMRVRYDYHEHHRGISATLLNTQGVTTGVGFAKYNPRDEGFSMAHGEKVALGRAIEHATALVPRGNIALNSFYPVVIGPQGIEHPRVPRRMVARGDR